MPASRHCRSLLLPLLLLLLAPAALPQHDVLPSPRSSPPWLASPAASLRRLTRHGIGLQYQYVHDLSKAPLGAPADHAWFGRYTWDLSASIDGRKLLGWSGLSAFVNLKQHVREFGSVYSGVSQGYSNLDADARTDLYSLWVQQNLAARRLRLKAGRIDANTDFDAVATAADFLNSSMGYSPTIMDFPTYPQPMPGGDLSVALPHGLSLAAGEFQTLHGFISVAEAARAWTTGSRQRPGRASLGFWNLREPLTRFSGVSVSASRGWYSVVEQSLWQRPLSPPDAGRQDLSAYLQLGTGDARVNPYALHLGAGAVWTSPLRRRPGDSLGLAATWVRLAPRPAPGAHHELALETYYKWQLSRSVSLVSDTQYFRSPGGARSAPGVLVSTPRLVVTF